MYMYLYLMCIFKYIFTCTLQAYFRRAEATRMRATQLQTHMDMYDKAMADYAKTYCLMSDPKSLNFRVERIIDIIKMGLERGTYNCCVYEYTVEDIHVKTLTFRNSRAIVLRLQP